MAPDGDTLRVEFSVTSLERVSGRGRLIGLAAVETSLDGVRFAVQGLQITREARGIGVRAPVYRHHDGRWLTAVTFPAELGAAIAAELLEMVGARQCPEA